MKKLFIIIFVLGLVGCAIDDSTQDKSINLPKSETSIELQKNENAEDEYDEKLKELQEEIDRKLILIEGYENLNKELREENDKLINEYEKTFKEREDAKAEIDKLKKENEELKKELETLKNPKPTEPIQPEPKEVPVEVEHIENEEIKNAYNRLPDTVKTLFKDLDCELLEVDTIYDHFSIPRLEFVGMFTYSNEGCGIQIDVEPLWFTKLDIEGTTFHEFGHMIDYGYNREYESGDVEFTDIYYDEKDYFVTDNNYAYATSNTTEYFADSFAEYMMNPQRLKDNTPRTYAYIDYVVHNIR